MLWAASKEGYLLQLQLQLQRQKIKLRLLMMQMNWLKQSPRLTTPQSWPMNNLLQVGSFCIWSASCMPSWEFPWLPRTTSTQPSTLSRRRASSDLTPWMQLYLLSQTLQQSHLLSWTPSSLESLILESKLQSNRQHSMPSSFKVTFTNLQTRTQELTGGSAPEMPFCSLFTWPWCLIACKVIRLKTGKSMCLSSCIFCMLLSWKRTMCMRLLSSVQLLLWWKSENSTTLHQLMCTTSIWTSILDGQQLKLSTRLISDKKVTSSSSILTTMIATCKQKEGLCQTREELLSTGWKRYTELKLMKRNLQHQTTSHSWLEPEWRKLWSKS